MLRESQNLPRTCGFFDTYIPAHHIHLSLNAYFNNQTCGFSILSIPYWSDLSSPYNLTTIIISSSCIIIFPLGLFIFLLWKAVVCKTEANKTKQRKSPHNNKTLMLSQKIVYGKELELESPWNSVQPLHRRRPLLMLS